MKYLLFILFIFCSNLTEAQYYVESFRKTNHYITSKTIWPDKKDIKKYRKMPVVFLEVEIPEFNAKIAKKDKLYEERFNKRKAVAIYYNNALKRIAKDIYPFKGRKTIKNKKSLKKLKDKKKYAEISLFRGILYFGYVGKYKAIYALPISGDLINSQEDMDAMLQFIFLRIKNHFLRMEKGGRYNKKVTASSEEALISKINEDASSKTLVVSKNDLEKGLSQETLSEIFKVKTLIVEQEEFNRIILEKPTGYWCLKAILVIHNSGYKQQAPGFSTGKMQTVRTYEENCAKYVIDPIDGTAVMVIKGGGYPFDEEILTEINDKLENPGLLLAE